MESSRPAPLADKSNAASEPERRASDGPKRERSPFPADVAPTQSGPEGEKPSDFGSALASPAAARPGGGAAGKKRALVEQSPKPVTRELPEALAEWKDYAEAELRQLHAFRRQGLLDWPLVKGAINCAVVSCPVASLRAEIRALRDNGVYGSSMVPYLQVLRSIFDSAQDCAEDAEEAPVEFSESDESDSDADDSDEEDSDEEDSEDSSQSAASERRATIAVRTTKRARPEETVEPGGSLRPGAPSPRASDAPFPQTKSDTRHAPPAVVAGVAASPRAKKPPRGASAPSAYQVEMRAKYKLFSRFLGAYFAKERVESASVASLASHPDATAFGDAEVVAFLDMLQRENKVMLHEGTVMII